MIRTWSSVHCYTDKPHRLCVRNVRLTKIVALNADSIQSSILSVAGSIVTQIETYLVRVLRDTRINPLSFLTCTAVARFVSQIFKCICAYTEDLLGYSFNSRLKRV